MQILQTVFTCEFDIVKLMYSSICTKYVNTQFCMIFLLETFFFMLTRNSVFSKGNWKMAKFEKLAKNFQVYPYWRQW